MKLNGNKLSEHDEAFMNEHMDEMLEAENHGLLGRVQDLERKVLSHEDDLVCLRSTLADVLRRLNTLDGPSHRGGTGHSAPTTPVRNGGVTGMGYRSNLVSPGATKDLRTRQPSPSHRPGSYNDHSSGRETPQNSRENVRRTPSYGTPNNVLPQRRSVHYQSTTSLHSADSHSSSSVSPAPSPSPRATPLPHPHPTITHVARTPSNRSTSGSASSLTAASLSKRWSSTGDFGPHSVGAAQPYGVASRFSTKSLLNLYSKPTQNGPALKHGTRDAVYNEEDGTIRYHLRGRPVHVQVPSDMQDSYDITKVIPAPSKRLKLDWVYGYRGRDCRSNLHLLPTGEMVYFVAAAVVLFNVDEQCQRHYLGHTDDVKSIAIHPNKLLVATGQCAGHDKKDALPHIRVWNSVSLATMSVIGYGEFIGSVNCLSFSRADGGSLLVAVDDSPDHVISVWEWQRGEKGHKVTETKCSVDTVIAAEFHPLEKNQIVTCGKNHIAFWTLDNGGTLYKRLGVFENRDKPKYVTCVAFNQSGDVLTGDSNGNLIIWGRGTNVISRFIKKVHEGSVFSICATKDGGLITGGGKDGRIVQYDSELENVGEDLVEGHFGAVRVISEGRGSQLLIGTTRNCILTGSPGLGFTPAVMGHTDELWGLAAHPQLPQFVTGGQDRLLQMWDSLSHSVVWSKDIGEQCQSCAFSSDGTIVVVGCAAGKWMAFDSVTRDLLTQHTDGQESHQCVQFSPDGSLLALGNRDNHIYVYQVTEEPRKFSRVGRCMGHSSFITHLDWSEDGQYLRSNSGDYELLYWNPSLCRQVVDTSSMRDVTWATHTCPLTFNSIGVWPESADGTDINDCAKSNDSTLMATADDFGKVKLFAYPVNQPKSLCHSYGGHSSHVTSVRFLYDDTRLVSIGGNDTSVMQWVVS